MEPNPWPTAHAGLLTALTLALCFLATKWVFFSADNGYDATRHSGGAWP